MESTDWIQTHDYGTSKNLIRNKEEIKCYNIVKR